MHPLLLRDAKQAGPGAAGRLQDEPALDDTDDGPFILCRRCLQIITGRAQRIAVQGAHEHTFFNPHGIVFQIGCFRKTRGCRYVGPASEEFTWFKGFTWRVAVCSACLTHLGWLFVSDHAEAFSGLILDRLTEPS